MIYFIHLKPEHNSTYHWILPYSRLLRYVRWFETDVSGLRIGPIFKSQDVQVLLGQLYKFFSDRLTHEEGTDT
jgi:hypothetical protein